jgi:hypothetical protein
LDFLFTVVVEKYPLLRDWFAMHVLQVAGKPESVVNFD